MVISRRRILFFAVVVSGFSFTNLSEAHNFFGDTQPLLNGVVHPFMTVPHLLLLTLIGLVILTQTHTLKIVIAFLFGLIAGFFISEKIDPALPSLALSLAFIFWGGFLALKPTMKFSGFCLPLVLSGFILGCDTSSELHNSWLKGIFYGGSLFAVLVFFSYALWLKTLLKKDWHQLVLRILGSWGFAIGTMMLAFFWHHLL